MMRRRKLLLKEDGKEGGSTAARGATNVNKEQQTELDPSSTLLQDSLSPYSTDDHRPNEKDSHLLSSSPLQYDDDDDDDDDQDMAIITRRSWLFSILITIFGLAMAAAFAFYGIEDSSAYAKERFHRRATELNQLIQSTWSDYEVTALTTHDFCRKTHNQTTRQDFRAYYQYVVAGGIEVQSLQCAWNVTHEDRPAMEAAARSYVLREYNYTDYQGFLGLVPNGEGGLMAVPREEHSYYVIVYYMEPFWGNAGALTLDIATDQTEGAAKLENAWRTRQPVLSGRLSTIQETEAAAYSVIIYHPGIRLSPSVGDDNGNNQEEEEEERPTYTSLLVRIPSLLNRVARLQEENLAIYIYTVEDTGERIFLGAASYQVLEASTKVEYLDEIDFDELMSRQSTNTHSKQKIRYERVPIASGSWDLVVLPIDDTYQPDLRFVFFGSGMIVLAAFGLAVWMYTNSRKILQIHKAKIQAEAERTIVTGLFPETIRERLLEGAQAENQFRRQSLKKNSTITASTSTAASASMIGTGCVDAGADHHGDYNARRPSALRGSKKSTPMSARQRMFASKPIADFHPAVTILCADLVGFSAWSSMREPSQVISFLEILFYDFDQIAQRHDIFKVETVGDCYVATCGLLKERKDHAIAIAKFAVECRNHMNSLVNELETTFGPETGDLSIRIGIHSGPVTGGVLRGEKGRFQLFGATVNTANQMESTGEPGQIHISPETADLFKASGKDYWLLPRPEKIFVKGRGPLQTYWLRNHTKSGLSAHGSSLRNMNVQEANGGGGVNSHHYNDNDRIQQAKEDRLVRWNVEQLSKLLAQIVARRGGGGSMKKEQFMNISMPRLPLPTMMSTRTKSGGVPTPLDEVMEMVYLPKFDAYPECNDGLTAQVNAEDVVLPLNIVDQLTELVTCIGDMYKNENSFHNFEHASHVAMSVTKLLARIADHQQPNHNNGDKEGDDDTDKSDALGFGITSDPLTHFAAFFSAMIHDVDHPGIPNEFFMEEKPQLAEKYKYKSIAEQHSFDLAWALFMKDDFLALRQYLFPPSNNNKKNNVNELKHFRQLVLTMVMATDLLDRELGMLRQERFKKAFSKRKIEGSGDSNKSITTTDDAAGAGAASSSSDRDRKAMIVIEYLLQCADISHTMQHWHLYRKWNENLFMEMYDAYKHNRIDQDPSKTWYEGEIEFFDYFVLPLATNLDYCGVFGVSGDEFRLYAIENRKEWERKGKQLVSEYLLKYDEHYQQLHPELAQDMVSYAHTGIIFEGDDDDEEDDDQSGKE